MDKQSTFSKDGRGLSRLHAELTSPIIQSLLRLHPNDIVKGDMNTPTEWTEWLDWSQSTPQGWLELVHYYMTGTQLSVLPTALLSLLDKIRESQIPRQPITIGALPAFEKTGMSPKKVHEASRMAAYILQTIRFNSWDPVTLRIVDVGAGQGYLTRVLKAQLPRIHILALDADEKQTIGAQYWEKRLLPPPSDETPAITHKTIHISPGALIKVIDEWLPETYGTGGPQSHNAQIALVGLHACGSLTLDIIRAFNRPREGKWGWKIAGVVVVGCCYNLMDPGDFPLSSYLKSLSPSLDLPTSAYHLAAQIPTQWLTELSPPSANSSVGLALRKVTWRALLGKKLHHLQEVTRTTSSSSQENINLARGRQLPWSRIPIARTQDYDQHEVGTGSTPEMQRLGRLRDSAYDDWSTFLDVAEKKIGADFGSVMRDTGRDDKLERFLEVVHTLRCLIGPLVESAIILDRMQWIDEMFRLEGREDMNAKTVNIFDQATGSGRNIAIVIAASIPPM